MAAEATIAAPTPRTAALAGGLAVCAAGLTSGVLLWAAAPPVGLGWLAWVALVPAAAVSLAAAGSRWGRLAVPLACGVYLELLIVPALPFGLAEDQWGDPVLPILVGDTPVLFAAFVGIPAFASLLYALRFPLVFRTESALGLVLLPALVWTVLDVLRVKFDPSGQWGPLFLSQHDLPTARASELLGPWLLTFAIVAVSYALALALVRSRRAGVAALVAVAALAGVVLATAESVEAGGGDTVRVAVVQPGYDTAEFERPVLHYLRRQFRNDTLASRDLIRDLGDLTRRAARRGAEVVVWPEATLWVEPSRDSLVRAELATLARSTGVTIVAPYFLRKPAHGATVTVLPDGTLTGAQPKQRPMWFLGENGGNRTAPRPVATPAGRIGTLLGVDNQDPGTARVAVAAGAALLASSTHDWRELAPEQRAFSQLHAVALARPLLRADWRSGSAIFDADGELRADAGLDKVRSVLLADVVPGTRRTLYSRVGDAFAWGCVAALAVVALLGLRRRTSAG
jgi:apolipoprotein N-acyltransferase